MLLLDWHEQSQGIRKHQEHQRKFKIFTVYMIWKTLHTKTNKHKKANIAPKRLHVQLKPKWSSMRSSRSSNKWIRCLLYISLSFLMLISKNPPLFFLLRLIWQWFWMNTRKQHNMQCLLVLKKWRLNTSWVTLINNTKLVTIPNYICQHKLCNKLPSWG